MKIKSFLIVLFSTTLFSFAAEGESVEVKAAPDVVKESQGTVLITGANRGLGLELSRQFAADGYHVIGTARSPEKAIELKEVADEVLALDVTSDESIKGLSAALKGQPIDILVHNAGYFGPTQGLGSERDKSSTLKALTRSEVLDCFAVNAAGPIFVTQGLIPNLKKSKQAKIVVISSRSGIINQTRSAGAYGYRISKTAVNRAVKIMSVDKALGNSIVVAVAPGHNKTDMGGDRAKLTPEVSMQKVKSLIEGLTQKQAGRFWYYNGEELPW
ncbi:SDR family oxidoreductase [Rubritalea spongiae]|uniref:SDR family oxidoreductase n=1 Tax=Rubritalea spongiae TaxID=430797 RepID=A0ABW5DXN3_9BACT